MVMLMVQDNGTHPVGSVMYRKMQRELALASANYSEAGEYL
jgi:hypothetical protein